MHIPARPRSSSDSSSSSSAAENPARLKRRLKRSLQRANEQLALYQQAQSLTPTQVRPGQLAPQVVRQATEFLQKQLGDQQPMPYVPGMSASSAGPFDNVEAVDAAVRMALGAWAPAQTHGNYQAAGQHFQLPGSHEAAMQPAKQAGNQAATQPPQHAGHYDAKKGKGDDGQKDAWQPKPPRSWPANCWSCGQDAYFTNRGGSACNINVWVPSARPMS